MRQSICDIATVHRVASGVLHFTAFNLPADAEATKDYTVSYK